MNYIAEINAFYNKLEIDSLSTGQIALWHALMHINNKCCWIEWFTVANKVLEINTHLTRDGIAKARNVLKQKGFIDFKSNGTNATSYKLMSLCTISNNIQGRIQDCIQDCIQGRIQDCIQDSMQDCIQSSTTLNKQNKTKLNKKENIKEKYGEFENVELTVEELEKIKIKYPDYKDRIERLSAYIASSGKKYKSHYATIETWARKEGVKPKPIQKDVFALDD